MIQTISPAVSARFCRLFRAADAVSELYLIAPENSVSPDALADGWGLVYVRDDLTWQVVRPPENRNVPAEKRVRMALNIAATSQPDVLFAAGIQPGSDGPVCGPLPRRRRLKSSRAQES